MLFDTKPRGKHLRICHILRYRASAGRRMLATQGAPADATEIFPREHFLHAIVLIDRARSFRNKKSPSTMFRSALAAPFHPVPLFFELLAVLLIIGGLEKGVPWYVRRYESSGALAAPLVHSSKQLAPRWDLRYPKACCANAWSRSLRSPASCS